MPRASQAHGGEVVACLIDAAELKNANADCGHKGCVSKTSKTESLLVIRSDAITPWRLPLRLPRLPRLPRRLPSTPPDSEHLERCQSRFPKPRLSVSHPFLHTGAQRLARCSRSRRPSALARLALLALLTNAVLPITRGHGSRLLQRPSISHAPMI